MILLQEMIMLGAILLLCLCVAVLICVPTIVYVFYSKKLGNVFFTKKKWYQLWK